MGNSRLLKFRAWDKQNKQMRIVSELDFAFYKTQPKEWKPQGQLTDVWLENEQSSYAPIEVVLMQYTGLKDKNGRAIYEKDIVKDYLGNIHEVKYFEGRWCAPIVKKVSPHWGAVYLDCVYMDWEVIGNVFENPELLKGDENG